MSWSRLSIKWLALLGAMLLGLGLWFLFSEPRARGRTLDELLEEGLAQGTIGHGENSAEVNIAIREIGSKAIPILLEKLRATDPVWKRELAEMLRKQSLDWFKFRWAPEAQCEALYGFAALGTNARTAIPPLEKMFWDTNTTWVAGHALARIGEAALPILRAGLPNADHSIRLSAFEATEVSPALRVATLADMGRMRNDPDEEMASGAVRRLMEYATREEATRLAIEALESNRLLVKIGTLIRLKNANIETNKVVPILVHLLEDLDSSFRFDVARVLTELDPVAASAAA